MQQQPARRWWSKVAVALIATAFAALAREALRPAIGSQFPFITFFAAVAASAWYGGFGTGMLAAGLGAVVALDTLIVAAITTGTLPRVAAIGIPVFLAVGALISMLLESLHRARQTVFGQVARLREEVARRETAEHQAAARAEQLHQTLVSIGDGVVVTDAAGVVQLMNPVAERLTGWTSAEATGKTIDAVCRLVHQESGRPALNPAHTALQTNTVSQLADNVVLVRRDGTRTHVDDTAAPIHDTAGRIDGCVLVFRDVTRAVAAEQDVVAAATAMREADKRKDEFVATLAHELRNPLAPLQHAVQLLKANMVPEVRRAELLGVMQRQVAQMTHLVDDLIDLSRIQQDRLEVRRAPVALDVLMQRALEAVAPLVEDRRHTLEVHLPESSLVLDGDAVRLTQAFTNLLRNACKYTDPGGRITVSAERQGDDAVLTISDNGIGIPADRIEVIFELFAQGHEARETSRGGLGIGLTLVRRVVELHGGVVKAYSDGPGRGSTFKVRLPTTRRPVSPTPPLPLPSVDHVRGRRFLVADDNHDSADTLAMLLRERGGHATTAYDGVEAVEEFIRIRPEIVLLDIGMPNKNGYEACAEMRRLPGGTSATIIALTGWGQPEDQQRSLEVGFDAHLVKPVDYAALARLLRDRAVASPSWR